MAEAVAKSTVSWVGKQLAAEVNYLGEVRDEVEALRKKLKMLADFCVEASKNRLENDLVQTALLESQDLAYDCQDVIETYILQKYYHDYEQYEGCQLRSILRWAFVCLKAVPLHEIHSEIDGLNRKIRDLENTLSTLGVTVQLNNINNQQPSLMILRPFHPHKREEFVVVGFEDQLTELVKRLKDPDGHMVIAISGMGGVGKSTLAMELYHHPMLRKGGNFQSFGWATASQQLQPKIVLQTLLHSLVPENDVEGRKKIDADIRIDQAHGALYNMMKQVNCLVVIDDIWTPECWSQLEAAFPKNVETGSRLVLTTRNQNVLSTLDSSLVHFHPLNGLDEMNSWKLFEQTAFSSVKCTDSCKEQLGRQMLRHCKGVPLAIVVLARLLKTKQSTEDWEQICNDISTQIQRGATPPSYKEVYDVLRVSYHELPVHLKHCFLQFAYFPEDYKIPADKLYQLWVAEGMVSTEDAIESEEYLAETYLNELVNRHMVQVDEYWDDGTNRIRTCRMHDLMRDVCIEIARRGKFFEAVKCRTSMLHHKNANHLLMTSLPPREKRLRHLAVYLSQHQEAQCSTNRTAAAAASSTFADVSRAPNLRTLMIFPVNAEEGDEEDCPRLMEAISRDYPLLQVLDCKDIPIKGKLPKKVGDLIRLRYLSVEFTRITEVSSSIQKLQWLLTLNLMTWPKVELSLPNILWKLKQLRHLYLPKLDFVEHRPGYLIQGGGELRLDGLCNLQTLVGIDLDSVSLKGLSELDRLKTLEASCDTKREALYPFINRTNIKFLRLDLSCQIINEDPMILSRCNALRKLQIYGREGFCKLKKPLCVEMLPGRLAYIGLFSLQLDVDPSSVQEDLPNLRELRFFRCNGDFRH